MSSSVSLLAHTPAPDEVIVRGARLCYSPGTAADRWSGEIEPSSMRGLMRRLRKSGHLSPFEHASFTFGIDGISRVCSHQLVRHRLASFSQQSQRYVSMTRPRVVLPPSIEADPEARKIFDAVQKKTHEAYETLCSRGIPREDARYLLPHGFETSLVMTMNARELLHFFSLRLCRRAQWEIREMAREMLRQVRIAAPCTFEVAGPSCVVLGRCEEEKPCGNPYSTMDALLGE